MSASRAGLMAFGQTYREESVSLTNYAYGDWSTRISRYDLFDFYDQNTIYSQLNRYAETMKSRHNLYRHIRGIYNPVHRLTGLETAKTYGGQIDWTGGLRTGAIPVEGADDRLIDAILQLLKWSNFGTQKGPYVRQGAKYGDSFLKVVDDFGRGRVRLEVLDPRDVHECEFDAVGNIKRICIQYERLETEGANKGKTYTYREEITQDQYSTYKGDSLFAYYRDHAGELVAQWDNPYGFVPVRHVPHTKGNSDWGSTSFQSSLGKINELNDLASLAHDAVRKAVNPIFVAIGNRIPEADPASREKDEVIVLNLPKDGKVETITPQVDMPGIMLAMDKLIGEIERDMPQLSLQRIRESGGDASGVSIENAYSDAADLLVEIQGNYDQGLVSALQMGITIAGMRGYAAFKGYTIDSFQSGDLEFYIKEREVFSDRLTADRKIELLLQASNTAVRAIVMRDLGYSEDDIEDVEMVARQSAQEAISAAMRGLAQGAGLDEDEDVNEDTETTQAETAPAITEP